MNEFVARSHPAKCMLMILGSLIFVAIGSWMTGLLEMLFASGDVFNAPTPSHSRRYPDWLIKPMGWACIVLFSGSAIAWTRNMFSNQARIRISATGITVPSILDRPISWSEISSIKTWSTNGQTMMVFNLQDPSVLRSHAWRNAMDDMNRKLTGGDLVVSMNSTNKTLAQALEAIAFYRPENWRGVLSYRG